MTVGQIYLRSNALLREPLRAEHGAAVISADASECRVRVIATDEERMIARHTRRTLGSAAR